MSQCTVNGCDRKYYGKGYCHYHWTLEWRKARPLYGIWATMKQRCYAKNRPRYADYGGRGVSVCERWRTSYQNFEDDMLPTYKRGLTLDRKDNEGNYTPGNCRWATHTEQNLNQRVRKDNTSGYSGVSWYKPRQKWIVRYSRKFIGYFDTRDEAIAARKIAENNSG